MHSRDFAVHSFFERYFRILKIWGKIARYMPISRDISPFYPSPADLGWYLPQRHCAYRMACKLLFMSFLVRAKMMGVWRIFRQIVIVIHLSFDRWFEQFFVACSHFSPHKRIYLHLSIIHCFTKDCKRKNRINSRIAELFSRRCVDFFGYLLRS